MPDYWDHPSRREIGRLIDLGEGKTRREHVNELLDDLQDGCIEWDDVREALTVLLDSADREVERLREEVRRQRETAEAASRGWRIEVAEVERLRRELEIVRSTGENWESALKGQVATAEHDRDEARAELAECKRLSTGPTRDDLTGLETRCALLHAAADTDPLAKEVTWRAFALIRSHREQIGVIGGLHETIAAADEDRDEAIAEIRKLAGHIGADRATMAEIKTALGLPALPLHPDLPDSARRLRADRDRLAASITALADTWQHQHLDGDDPEDRWDRGHAAAYRQAVPQLRALLRGEVWDSGAAPGGYVCAAPVDPDEPGIDRPEGRICGRPVESEPCDRHQQQGDEV